MQTVHGAHTASNILIMQGKGRLSCALQCRTMDKTSTSGSVVDGTEILLQGTLLLCLAGMTHEIL